MQLLEEVSLRMPFVSRDLLSVLRMPMFSHALRLLKTGKGKVERSPIPALMSVSGGGKSRFMYELANFSELAFALQCHADVMMVPIAVTFNNMSSLTRGEVENPHRALCKRIIAYPYRAASVAFNYILSYYNEDSVPAEALRRVLQYEFRNCSNVHVMVFLLVDEITRELVSCV